MSAYQLAGYFGGILATILVIPYIWEIFYRQVKPERASWLVWTVLAGISFFSQRSAGAGASLWFTAGNWLGVLIVFIISIFKGVGGLTWFDLTVLGLAGLGTIGWLTLGNPALAITSIIFADFVGTLPTIIKAYHQPASESKTAFAIGTVSAAFGVFAVGSLNPILLAFPGYLLLADGAVVVAILLGRRAHHHRA